MNTRTISLAAVAIGAGFLASPPALAACSTDADVVAVMTSSFTERGQAKLYRLEPTRLQVERQS